MKYQITRKGLGCELDYLVSSDKRTLNDCFRRMPGFGELDLGEKMSERTMGCLWRILDMGHEILHRTL